jgi:hypothetical protein
MSKMISRWMSLAVVALVGCVPGSSPIRINGLFPIDTGMGGAECNLQTDIGISRGRLDASGGGDYILVLRVASDLDNAYTIQSNRGVDLTPVSVRNFNFDQVALTYRSINPSITFEAETIPATGTVPPGEAEALVSTDIIGDKAAARLRDMLTDPTVTTQLTVNIQLRGHLESGETVQSNTVSFPIEVTTTNAACTEPGNVTRSGPCGSRGGQDGSVFACCTGPGAPVGCP